MTLYGYSDYGLITMSEMVANAGLGTVRGTCACQQIPTASGFKRQFDAIRQGRPIG